MEWSEVSQWCPSPDDLFKPGDSWTVENPLSARVWTAPEGTSWRRRGGGELDARQTRRLIEKRHPRVFHVYDTVPHEHTGAGLVALMARVEEFWAGRLEPMDHFRIGEFRSANEVLLVITQSC